MEDRADVLRGRGEALVGYTYPSISSYLKDQVVPSEEFLREAADVLDVPYDWLRTGEEPEQRARQEAAELEFSAEFSDIDKVIQEIDGGDLDGARRLILYSPRFSNRRNALLRFALMLDDASAPGVPWRTAEGRMDLLRLAGRFLVEVDQAFERAASEKYSATGFADWALIRSPDSRSWWTMHYDRALALFAERVRGLGVADR
jgi:transcriptional regulator with XRE-family HTH domain